MTFQTATLGYPRIGKNREVKKALEAFWSGKSDTETLLQTLQEVEFLNWKTQLEAGIDRIGIGDTTLYEHVLDWTVRLSLIPERFQSLTGLDQYFAMARGKDGIPALEMTKWFDTNYHYLVPESAANASSQANFAEFLTTVQRSQSLLGDRAVPIILSPVTLLKLSRLDGDLTAHLHNLLPLYRDLLTQLKAMGVLAVQLHEPIASLQFVPYDAQREIQLLEPLRNVLSFAEQKLEEVMILAKALSGGDPDDRLAVVQTQWATFEQFSPANEHVQTKLKNLTTNDFERSLSYFLRLDRQLPLPILPTTTIGSFPQTSELRQLRVKHKRGELSEAEYQAAINAYIAECIKLQEDIGIDVLVHGEFERTDMVEYFGQQLAGFAFTEHGWVQSYGSRYVRPPIIYGDVARPQPMTVREFQVAQALTKKPVKGMLTGPVTILNWSFPRADIVRQEQAFQIALALREEVADLEAAGAQVIQIDEPALREGLPLKLERWSEYLSWAVDAFRLAAAIAQPQTQIHTHMCYCEFGDIIKDIERLDADVISIENSRSNNRTLQEVTAAGYAHQIGNGVYDIHSPVVPTTEQLVQQLQAGITNLPLKQIWVNPDCGLKTRRWQEVIPALKNMVEAAKILREEGNAKAK
jgi:5-methyltetrahydropteroyltriglutamate--homocysteine methyltransferase